MSEIHNLLQRSLELYNLIQSTSEATKPTLLDSLLQEGSDPFATAIWNLITKLIQDFNSKDDNVTNLRQIENHCTEVNGIYFSKSRFSNIYQLKADHNEKALQILNEQRFGSAYNLSPSTM